MENKNKMSESLPEWNNSREFVDLVIENLSIEDKSLLEKYISPEKVNEIIETIIIVTESISVEEAIENIRIKLRRISSSSIPNKAIVQLTLAGMEEMKSSSRTKRKE